MTATARNRKRDDAQRSIFDYVAPVPTGNVRTDLIELARERAKHCDLYGVIIGEIVKIYEETPGNGLVGGVEMEDKNKQQRQTSWLARVLPEAGLIPTAMKRPSPLKRHHRKEQRVYVHPDVKGYKPAAWYDETGDQNASEPKKSERALDENRKNARHLKLFGANP